MKVVLFNRDADASNGGDMIQIRAYERELNKIGVIADYDHLWDKNINDYDLANLTHLNFGWTYKHYLNCKRSGKPYVVSAIFYPFEVGDMSIAQMKEVLDGCKKVMFLSKAEAEDCKKFLSYDIPDNKLVIINNGVDEIFKPEGEVWDKVKDYILNVGRLEGAKGQIKLTKACKELGLPLVLIGKPVSPEVKQTCQQEYPETTFIDYVPHEELPKYYRGAKVYVCPSESERHNLCLMEAAACGCNLVSSTENRGNEWFGEELTVVNPFHGVIEMEEAIQREYDKPKNNQFVSKIPYWGEVAKTLKGVYEEALA